MCAEICLKRFSKYKKLQFGCVPRNEKLFQKYIHKLIVANKWTSGSENNLIFPILNRWQHQTNAKLSRFRFDQSNHERNRCIFLFHSIITIYKTYSVQRIESHRYL